MSIAELIAAHSAAVLADEAAYDDDCQVIDQAVANATDIAERAAFDALVLEPCRSAADIAAKVSYFLEPAPGFREGNATGLTGVEGDSWDARTGPELLMAFLRSLIIAEAGS